MLGCDGSWPGPGGAGSGYLVRAGNTAVVLDLGPGTFARLQQHLDPSQVSAVVLTHAHPDHWTDVDVFATWLGYGPGAGMRVRVLAPPGLRARSHYAQAPWIGWEELAPSLVCTIGALTARFVATDHGTPTLAVGLAHGGATLAYSADSGPGWSVEELGPAETFLCEATYTAAREGALLHLSGRQAGAMARAAGVRQLILTHRWPTVSAAEVRHEAEQAFGGPVAQAEAGAVFSW